MDAPDFTDAHPTMYVFVATHTDYERVAQGTLLGQVVGAA